ncbi:unnamed protein product [Spirodela intermedia]|uniref:Uncharacterized protein n=1 Tax=Spirodela intermedia TaxID=51605 RepID=A0A7I8IGE9_SPIIN|nr:unnamed protein product [Spirodela intermedia]CAA6656475.1 unnamed protein product [Spirodela intermedia]
MARGNSNIDYSMCCNKNLSLSCRPPLRTKAIDTTVTMSASAVSSLLLPAAAAPASTARRYGGAAAAAPLCRARCFSNPSPPPVALDRKSGDGGVRSPPRFSVRSRPAASVAYGALLLGGGLFAYARTKSTGSISGGVSGAALMAVAYYLMQNPETKAAGEALGFGSAALFTAIFGIRLASTRKFMPAGLLLGVSGGAMAVFVSAYLQDKI